MEKNKEVLKLEKENEDLKKELTELKEMIGNGCRKTTIEKITPYKKNDLIETVHYKRIIIQVKRYTEERGKKGIYDKFLQHNGVYGVGISCDEPRAIRVYFRKGEEGKILEFQNDFQKEIIHGKIKMLDGCGDIELR